MPIQKLRPSFSFNDARLHNLQAVVPEAFADGKVNWETLREALGNYLEEDEQGAEHFGLSWPGKRDARRLAAQPSRGTLLPVPGEGVREDVTGNLLIEGDNLEVLKLLQKSYVGGIKIIYIDPPYNTGNDFIYIDDFTEPLETYLARTNQMSDRGELLTSNPRADGRFHSKWLSMMYPRLKIARTLLSNDGLIFLSIDDNELHNLRMMMNEIFGEENFVNIVTIATKVAAGASGGGEDKRLKKNVEYLLVYAKNYDEIEGFANAYQEEPLLSVIERMKMDGQSWKYTSVILDQGTRRKLKSIADGDGNPIDVYLREGIKRASIKSICDTNTISEEQAYLLNFERVFSDTNAQTSIRTRVMEAFPPLTPDQMYDVEYVPRSGRDKGKKVVHYYISNTIRRVIWLHDVAYEKDGKLIKKERLGTLWDTFNYNNVGKEGGIAFPNGKKPIELIETCMSLISDRDCLVLDFFAGSASAAHATIRKNSLDNGRRRFICVQIPEKLQENEYADVCALAKARLRNVLAEYNTSMPLAGMDLGFRVLKIGISNFSRWNDYNGDSLDVLQTLFDHAEQSLTGAATTNAVIVEVLLLEGFPLHSTVERQSEYTHNVIWLVHSDTRDHRLYICLDKKLHAQTIGKVKLEIGDVFVCLDSALDDETKVRLADVSQLHVI